MKWENRATPRGLRLNKTFNNLHYEIKRNFYHILRDDKPFNLEGEDIIKGCRTKNINLTLKELLIRFPCLKEEEYLLTAQEEIYNLSKKIFLLEEKINKMEGENYER